MFWPMFLNIFVRSILSIAALFVMARMVGVRQIAQLTFYDYISGITIGSLAAVAALDVEIPLWAGILSMGIYALGNWLSALLTDKSIVIRRMFTGTPLVMIDNGKLIERNMCKARYDVNDLLRECRCQGYFDISQIAFALLETNGQMSIQPKAAYANPTNGDLQLNVPEQPLVANVIIDGHIMRENLEMMHQTRQWLKAQLKAEKLQESEVLLGTLDENGRVTFYPKSLSSDRARIYT